MLPGRPDDGHDRARTQLQITQLHNDAILSPSQSDSTEGDGTEMNLDLGNDAAARGGTLVKKVIVAGS
jgi:hypothetical protein